MKKLSYLVVIILFLVFIFNSCNQDNTTNTPMEPASDQQLSKKGGKKPVKEPPVIEYLKFVEIPNDPLVKGEDIKIIINDEVVLPPSTLIDFTKNLYRIDYRITHPTDIDYLQLHLLYDHNCDSELNIIPIEYDGRIGRFEFIGENDTEVNSTYIWEGYIRKGIWEFRVGLYPGIYDYIIFDQLATYNDEPNPPPDEESDHYILYVWTGPGYYERIADFWIKAISPKHEMHVEDIKIEKISDRGAIVFPRATITVNKPDVYVWAQWSGVVSSNYVSGGPSVVNEDGFCTLTIDGPKFTKNAQGDLTITIADLKKEDGCYNPYSDYQGLWPDEFSSLTLTLE